MNVVGVDVGDRQAQLQCLIDHQTKDFIARMKITAGSHGPARDRIGCSSGQGGRISGRRRFDNRLGQALPGNRQRLLLDLDRGQFGLGQQYLVIVFGRGHAKIIALVG